MMPIPSVGIALSRNAVWMVAPLQVLPLRTRDPGRRSFVPAQGFLN
jgi:hypothetical protein